MVRLLSLPSVGIGGLDVFMPSPPCLVLHTSYVDGEPESSVVYFWQDEKTGMLHHEVVYMQPVGFETALAWAQDHALTREVERIHVKHARATKSVGRKTGAKAIPTKSAVKKAAGRKAPVAKAPADKGRKPQLKNRV
jgi:hypothetical protein